MRTALLFVVLTLAACGGSSSSNDSDLGFGLRSIFPDNGPIAGDQTVAINGTGFDIGILRVLFDGVPATEIAVTSDQNINCRTPPGTPGLVDVTVETTDGQSQTLASAYRYNHPPRLRFIAPVAGPAGLTVTLVGNDFADGMPGGPEVLFGGINSPFPQLVSDNIMFATVPIGNPNGPVDVTVTNANGMDVLPNGFRYTLGPNALRTASVSGPEDVWDEGFAVLAELVEALLAGDASLGLDPDEFEVVLDLLIEALVSWGLGD